MGGKYSLAVVKQLVDQYKQGNNTALWFSARSRSLDAVVKVLSCNDVDAETTILDGLLKLKDSDFCRSNMQWNTFVDEYGLENYLGINWYIKFTIEQNGVETLEQISFHPLEKNMRLADGRQLTATLKK